MRSMRFVTWFLCLGWAGSGFAADAAQPRFESDVRPIFRTHCFACHGEEEKHEAGLDLRLARSIVRGGESGPALVPGDKDKSLLWRRVVAGEMPPGEKKLSDRERRVLAAWIDAGAPTVRPEPESLRHDDFTEEDRAFWSFQPVRRPPVPAVDPLSSHLAPRDVSASSHLAPRDVPASNRDGSGTSRGARWLLVRTPIDAFLLARLAAEGRSFADEADAATLIRRATFDLLGLPPTPAEVEAFVRANAAEPDAAWDELIDRLLASPHYGERWARHWLDVAGYADSDGFGEKDLERKWAYKYRDWLVRVHNADRPWDELLREQLAGDELLKPPFRGLTPEQADRLVATGFLRMGPDGTGDAETNQDVARNECVAETLKIVSTSLLGLTVGCAQCHAHRYDPISQVDYYRLRAIFEPAYDVKAWRTPTARLVSLWTPEQQQIASRCDAEIRRLEKERLTRYEALSEKLREDSIAGLDDARKERVRDAARTPVAKRTPEQKRLLADHPKAAIPVGTLLERNAPREYKAITDEFARLLDAQKRLRPTDDFAHCLTEVPGQIPETRLFYRGDFAQPRQAVAPNELAVLASAATSSPAIPHDDERLPTSGRRLAYARHLTSGQHPLVARVFVNRVWLHHFGRGLVNTPGDFGQLGERPSHPELLDWLADEFVRSGWSLKSLHRLLLTSTAYRQSSRRPEPDPDPDNRLVGRMALRRLDAETVRDAVLAASGRLTRTLGGPPVPVTPDETGQIIVGVDTRDGAGRPTGRKVPLYGEEFRRSLYIAVRRTMPLAMLESFDAATPAPNCVLRTPSTVAPQSLMLLNNEFVVQQAEVLARRVAEEAGDAPADQVRQAWRLVLSRDPHPGQVATALAFVADHAQEFAAQSHHRALASLCHSLLISNAFLYVD